MNYIGSKLKLIDFLDKSIKEIAGDQPTTFCDAFAGTGIVGSHFKNQGYQITSNDIQFYSYVRIKHLIGICEALKFDGLSDEIKSRDHEVFQDQVFDYLNNLPLENGFIYKNYSSGGTQGLEYERLYFSDENAKICDTIRKKIEYWRTKNKIDENEYFYLLSCLLEAVDKKANTASVYGAFLKKIKSTAKEKIVLKPLEIIESKLKHNVYNYEINQLIKSIDSEILYLDPPYNQRKYGDNYHILETIAKYDDPLINGKTGLRAEKVISNFSRKKEVLSSFSELINNSKSKYIFLSYNNEGLLTLDDIKKVMSKKGKYGFFSKKYSRFKADKSESRNHKSTYTTEYLHYVIV